MAFISATPLLSTRCTKLQARQTNKCTTINTNKNTSSSTVNMSISRREVLKTAMMTTLSLIPLSMLSPKAAEAANGEGLEKAFSKVLFPKEGFNVPADGPPPTIDQTILSTAQAKAAMGKLKGYQKSITDLYTQFKNTPDTMELTATVRNLVSISELRNALNVINEAINEEAQIASDKVVRGIIQDIGELENAAQLKKGSTRTSKKITRTTDWFEKLEQDFAQLLAFYG